MLPRWGTLLTYGSALVICARGVGVQGRGLAARGAAVQGPAGEILPAGQAGGACLNGLARDCEPAIREPPAQTGDSSPQPRPVIPAPGPDR
eukprot:326513-Chlamydomonas_euryale.AAC.1